MITVLLLGSLTIYVAVAITVTRLVMRLGNAKASKWAIGLISALMFTLIPTWEEIQGRIYFYRLCESMAGSEIMKSVQLGEEYYLKAGEINFNTAGKIPAKGGELNLKKASELFPTTRSSETLSVRFRTSSHVLVVTDLRTGEVMARSTQLVYFGSWLRDYGGLLHRQGKTCPERTNHFYADFYSNIFKKEGK